MKYKAAIFDFDGTLLDTLEDLADCMNAVLAANGMPVQPLAPYRYFVGDGMENLVRRAAPAGLDDETIQRMTRAMDEGYAVGWMRKTRPYPGIDELLRALKGRGLKMAVLSNKRDRFTKVMAKHYFGDDIFDIVMGAREDVPRKPDPAGALEIASLFQVAPADCLYLGDTNIDMRTGRSAGMHTVGVSWGFRPVAELEGAGAEHIINHPREALELLGDAPAPHGKA